MAHISADLLADIMDAGAALNPGDTLSPRALGGIAKHAASRDIRRSAETGAGGSTLLFSHLSEHHTAFAIEGDHSVISRVRASLLFRAQTTDFVEGPTQLTLPHYAFDRPLQAVLIDGPHAFPFPQLEYFYVYPQIAMGGLLIIDDIHIRTINELYRFLCVDEMFQLVEVIERTAFFRRTTAPVFDPFGDGWRLQPYNRKRLLRYTWRELLRKSLPSPVRAIVRQSLTPLFGGTSPQIQYPLQIDMPRQGTVVGETALVRGRAELPSEASLWLFARRADSSGWWPQGGGPIATSSSSWEQTCKFGEAHDEGYPFEIAVVAIDPQKHRRVVRWFDECSRSGHWGAMTLPEPMARAHVAKILVVRGKSQPGG